MEKRVADEVFQHGTEVVLGGKTYEAPPVTLATMIRLSEAVAGLPAMDAAGNRLSEVLREARHCRAIGEAAAVLLLGGRRTREARGPRGWRRLLPLRCPRQGDGAVRALAAELLETATPREMAEAIARLLARSQFGDFFALTTFLRGTDMTRPTKVGGTTASGPR